MGCDLNNPGNDATTRLPYDISPFLGIALWAKGDVSIRVSLPTEATTPSAEGGSCATNCSDNHGIVIALTPSWTQYVVAFAQLAQEGWGQAAAFDPMTVLALQFQAGANVPFDVWVDDVGLY